MKLPDALEQAVRALLAPNGSSRDDGRRAAPQSEGGRAEEGPSQVALRIEEATTEPVPVGLPAPRMESRDETHASDDAGILELERAAAVVERIGLGFHLGSAVERIALASGEGSDGAQKLREAAWLIERYLELLERRPVGADLHLTMMRLAREGDTIAGLQALATAFERAPAPEAEAAPEPSTQTSGPPPTEHVIPMPHPSVARELLLASARALIVVAAVVGIVLALTLIAQLN